MNLGQVLIQAAVIEQLDKGHHHFCIKVIAMHPSNFLLRSMLKPTLKSVMNFVFSDRIGSLL